MAPLVMIAGFLFAISAPSAPAYACSCATLDAAEQLEYADVVVRGAVVNTERDDPDDSFGGFTVELAVSRVYRGESGTTLEFHTGMGGGDCGLGGSFSDAEQVWFLGRHEGGLSANICSQPMQDTDFDKLLGPGEDPEGDTADSGGGTDRGSGAGEQASPVEEQAADDGSMVPWLVGGGVGLALVAVLLLVLRTTRRA